MNKKTFIDRFKTAIGGRLQRRVMLPSVKEEEINPFHRMKIFCIGETAEESVAGDLETMIPLEVGHIHFIKGRKWRCTHIEDNIYGEPLADFRPAT